MHADVAETTTDIADADEEEGCQRMHAGSVMEREPDTRADDADADDGGFSDAGHGPPLTASPLLSPLSMDAAGGDISSARLHTDKTWKGMKTERQRDFDASSERRYSILQEKKTIENRDWCGQG